jgi:hypothetical protein
MLILRHEGAHDILPLPVHMPCCWRPLAPSQSKHSALLPYSHENPEVHCPPSPEYIFLAKMFKTFREVTLTPGATAPQRVSITRPYHQPQATPFTYPLALNILLLILLQLVVKHPVSAPQQPPPMQSCSLSTSNSVPASPPAVRSRCAVPPTASPPSAIPSEALAHTDFKMHTLW